MGNVENEEHENRELPSSSLSVLFISKEKKPKPNQDNYEGSLSSSVSTKSYELLIGKRTLTQKMNEFAKKNVWLLEMNANPALHTNCQVLRDIIPTIVYESLDLVLEVFKKRLKGQRVLPFKTLCRFVLLYHEDAADLGQKQPSKFQTGPCTGRFLKPQTGKTSPFGQSPAKRLETCSSSTIVEKPSEPPQSKKAFTRSEDITSK